MEPALYNIDRKYDCVIEPENEVREVLEILGSGIQTTVLIVCDVLFLVWSKNRSIRNWASWANNRLDTIKCSKLKQSLDNNVNKRDRVHRLKGKCIQGKSKRPRPRKASEIMKSSRDGTSARDRMRIMTANREPKRRTVCQRAQEPGEHPALPRRV